MVGSLLQAGIQLEVVHHLFCEGRQSLCVAVLIARFAVQVGAGGELVVHVAVRTVAGLIAVTVTDHVTVIPETVDQTVHCPDDFTGDRVSLAGSRDQLAAEVVEEFVIEFVDVVKSSLIHIVVCLLVCITNITLSFYSAKFICDSKRILRKPGGTLPTRCRSSAAYADSCTAHRRQCRKWS